MSDHVPLGAGKIGEGRSFPSELLHAIFTEQTESSGVSFANALRSMGLAHCHQRDLFRIPTCAPRCLSDSFAHCRDVFRNGHQNLQPRRARRSTKECPLAPCRLVSCAYMMAVGGAGSSGLPALARGTRTIARTSTRNAASEAQMDGVQWTSVTSLPEPTRPAMTRPHKASPAIRPE